MLDWFFANMEKSLLFVGSRRTSEFSMEGITRRNRLVGSVEYIYETNHFLPVYETYQYGQLPVYRMRSHCWISDGTFGDSGRGMQLIHMYDEIEKGTKWITIKLVHKSDADWIREYRSTVDPAKTLAHNEYEAGRFKDFLPEIYRLWKDIPNPSQNVSFDTRTKQNPDGTWSHICDNKPPVSTSVNLRAKQQPQVCARTPGRRFFTKFHLQIFFPLIFLIFLTLSYFFAVAKYNNIPGKRYIYGWYIYNDARPYHSQAN